MYGIVNTNNLMSVAASKPTGVNNIAEEGEAQF